MVDQFWTLPDVIKHWGQQTPDQEPFIFINKHGRYCTLNASDIYVLAGRFASRLRRCGFEAGDVIANGLPNSPERVITDFGIVMAGCVSLNCQIIEKDGGDFWNTARISECKGVIFPDQTDNPACRLFSKFILDNSQDISGYRDISLPEAEHTAKAFVIIRSPNSTSCTQKNDTKKQNGDISSYDHESFLASLAESDEDVFMAECQPNENAYIFTTSGSTGPCKLVPRSHRELLRMARGYNSPAETKYFNDRQLSWLGGFPFDYFRNCMPRLLQDVLGGHQAQTVQELWTLLKRERCDGAFLAPSDVLQLVKEFEGRPPDFRLKFITTAGVCLRQSAMAALGNITDSITNMYASTETGIIALLTVTDASEFKDCVCGRPPDGVQIRVVDDKMEDVPRGQEGNVLVKSQNMFRHYYNCTPREPAFTPDGWFIIRDRGVLDESGSLSVTCRQGDVVSQGITLIYFSWPESVLGKCPDVREVTVVGIQDAGGDDVMYACVVARPCSGLTEESLLEFYNETFMTSLSKSILKPQIRGVIFYDAFPFNSLGKLEKRKLRDDATARLFQQQVT
ncbi:unnamed protein product [Candidula unifasciata]|uniref:Medium-chain acyl-CoA ligase ACSF2, mitochondrial n=1 Tax=Candidula unifasciata TaxID=100452 RepID=A0A8S3ZP75_9EUPU|nr:unnamed protein product [Candidula unifasciata]